jgi:hypothetical protein
MHGTNFKGLFAKGPVPGVELIRVASSAGPAIAEMRHCVEWMDVPDDNSNNKFHEYLHSICRRAGQIYVNKILVVMGDTQDGDWVAAGYAYDGRRCGVCEVRLVEKP